MQEVALSLAAFAIGLLCDIAWAACVRATGERRAVAAANWGVAIYVASLLYVGFVVHAEWCAAAAYAVGGWIGTYLIVRRANCGTH